MTEHVAKARSARSARTPDTLVGSATTLGNASSLPQLIYDRMKGDILTGALEVGQVLRQEEIARQFNVSRVPLREAFSRLEADGLLEARPRRGFAVATLDPKEILEVFELRSVIEEHAGRVAAQARTEQDVLDAEDLIRTMEALDRSDPDFVSRWMLLNYEFHSRIIASSGRRRLARIAGNLRGAVEPYVRVELFITGDVDEAAREHRELLEAFRAGDGNALGRLSREHVDHTAGRLLAGLRARAVDASTRDRGRQAA
jgi:DNA-binding GntR family transcriptional regulator